MYLKKILIFIRNFLDYYMAATKLKRRLLKYGRPVIQKRKVYLLNISWIKKLMISPKKRETNPCLMKMLRKKKLLRISVSQKILIHNRSNNKNKLA